ncbi:Glycerol kinase [Frankliniella fusca]|uniref:Glycerol kinase n=1 Tax=Frankliniella fusca TaxID=407009 RepID=A0AAE1LFJ7_9NEOP|nr:Glycerol kinase [Frankliniella fusca]
MMPHFPTNHTCTPGTEVAFQTNDWAPPDRMTGQWEVEARQDDRGGEKQKEKFLRKSKRTLPEAKDRGWINRINSKMEVCSDHDTHSFFTSPV